MMRIDKYQILTSPCSKELQAEMNERIAQGWQPWGSLQFSSLLYVQAVVRYLTE